MPRVLIEVKSVTPLCNRPSGILILAGLSGKSQWVGQFPTESAYFVLGY